MKIQTWRVGLAAATLLTAAPLFAQQTENQGQGQAIITVLPKGKDATAPSLSQQNLSLKIDGKDAQITRLTPAQGRNGRLELVVMLDSGARTSLSTQLSDISDFIKGLPAGDRVAVGWMENGVTQLTSPLSTNHEEALKGLHIPGGFVGEDASPYFCLSDLAKRWPSDDPTARREVVMISDGVDYYYRHYDPDDPYVQSAINDSIRAGMVVYSIYWKNKGGFDQTEYANDSGQNLLLELTQATGGTSFWEGMGDPVSLQPYFKDLNRRLQNQYEVGFIAPLKNKPDVLNMKVKVQGFPAKVDAPQRVYVGRSTGAAGSMQ